MVTSLILILAAITADPEDSPTQTLAEAAAAEKPAASDTAPSDDGSPDRSQDRPEESSPDRPARPAVTTITAVEFPDRHENAPDWLEAGQNFAGQRQTAAVASGLYHRERDCETALQQALSAAVEEYVNDYLGSSQAARMLRLHRRDGRLDPAPLVAERFAETVLVSFGAMQQQHALLVFDDDYRQALDQDWAQVRAISRLAQTALGGGVLLLLLGTVCGFFRLDTATRGFYSGRLQVGAAATILVVIVAGVLLARSIDWL